MILTWALLQLLDSISSGNSVMSASHSLNHSVIHSDSPSSGKDQSDSSSSFVIEFKDDTYKSGPPGSVRTGGLCCFFVFFLRVWWDSMLFAKACRPN